MGGGGGSGSNPGSQYFSLRWNNHPVNLVSVFTGLYQAESLVDVSLAAEGRHVQAHKVVLSACSEYFQSLFAANPCQHPIVILKDVAFEDLQVVVKFMYYGIVNVSADKLPGVLKTADALQIKGLEKNNDLLSPYLGSPRLLPLPSQQGRQPSTESLPEYLQRSRSEGGFFPHRAHSAESRGFSFDSGPLDISRLKRQISPPGSPTHSSTNKQGSGSTSYARKKFRNRSDAESASTDERIEPETKKEGDSADSGGGGVLAGGVIGGPGATSPLPDRSLSRYSSSDTEHIAKKKRAMFQARRTGSDSGSKSSDMQHSSSEGGRSDKENKHIESSLSLSRSISHSSDREESEAHIKDTLQVPGVHPRTLVRTVSASEVQGALSTKFKRGRFLKRQQCQEATEDTESSSGGVTKSEPPPSPPSITVSSPASLVKQLSHPLLPSQSYSSPPSSSGGSSLFSGSAINSSRPPMPMDEPPLSPPEPAVSPPMVSVPPPSTTTRQPSLDPLCGLESLPLLYSNSGPGPRLTPPANLLRPSLPSVRVIPENEPVHEILPHQYPPSIPSPSLLYPQMPPYEQPPHLSQSMLHQERKPPPSSMSTHRPRAMDTLVPPTTHHSPYSRNNPDLLHSSSSISRSTRDDPLSGQSEQFGHCPKARDGPALSCNFCWNTTDGSGRILRRKTKYHCPECQTNLCIVPCFQQFHEALENEGMGGQ